ncbi:MAG: glycosyltransferase family 39 protein [Candidatus Omnitrophota bacterium]
MESGNVTLSISKSKFLGFAFIALFYAGFAGFLLLKIRQGEGLYESWDTTRYLVAYCIFSLVYFMLTAKMIGVRPVSIIAPAAISAIIFSLSFSLFRLSASLLNLSAGFKVQKMYFMLFYLVFSSGVLYYSIDTFRYLASVFRKGGTTLSLWRYLTFHYLFLAPYLVYVLIKDVDIKGIMIAAAAAIFFGLCALAFRNKSLKDRIVRLLEFLWAAKRFIFLVFLFALAVRVLFAVQMTHNLPAGFMEGPDSFDIDKEACYISQTWNITDNSQGFLNQKGAVILSYALIYKIFGYNPFYARLFDALLGAVCVVFTYFIAGFFFGPTASKIAAFLSAGYGYLIQYGVYIGTEAVGLFTIELFILGVLIASRKQERIFSFWSFVSGLSLALCVLARPEYYYSLFIVIPWSLYVLRKKKASMIFFIAGFLIISGLWSYRNFLAFGKFTLSSLVTAENQEGMLAFFWRYETLKFAEAGLPIKSMTDMFFYLFSHPAVAANIIFPHILKGAYNFWDYNIFFSPAFIFIEPKNSCYNLILCFYLYCFMFMGFFLAKERRGIAMLLLFLVVFKMISYIFTTTPTFIDDGGCTALFKDWYRFTITPFTHIFMAGGLAFLITKSVAVFRKTREFAR